MALDPSVQVALITVITTAITTGGVVYVGRSGTNKERKKAADAGVEEGLDENNAVALLAPLVRENARKEGSLQRQAEKIAELEKDKEQLQHQNEELTEDLADANGEITKLQGEVQWLKDQLTQRGNQ